jgi:hypothetical protein
MTSVTESDQFDQAMKSIFRADPAAVRAAIDAEIEANTAEREARGELKRGRKPKATSASVRASSAND